MTAEILFYLDIDTVQDFIFSTNRLRMITGASTLLDRINRQETLKLLEAYGFGNDPRAHTDFILSSGGQTKLLFDDIKEADNFGRALKKIYHKAGVTVTIHCEEVVGGDEKTALENAEAAMARKKYQKTGHQTITAAPFIKYCRECGREPAAGLLKSNDQKTIEPCATCFRKWQAGIEKVPFFNDFSFDHEIAKIAGNNDKGFVALVALDGNAMGKKISRLKNFAELKTFSTATEELLRDSLISTTTKFFPPDDFRHISGFRPLICGGDDIMFICRANQALQVTRELIETIAANSEETTSFKDSPLQMSAGVLFMKQKYPFAIAARLVTSLLSSAKMKSRKEKDCAALDYHIVSSGASENIRDLRLQEGHEKRDPDGRAYLLSNRPYTITELEELIRKGKKLNEYLGSRTRVESLRKHFNQGRDYATIMMYKTAARLSDEQRRKFRREFIDNKALWKEKSGVWITELLDIIELSGLTK